MLATTFFALPLFAIEIPELTRPVMDQAGILSASQVEQLESYLQTVRPTLQTQVWIIPSLDGGSVEDLSIRAADKWKLGDAKKDNGVLFLVAVNDKRMRIEVGRGLEGDIPDILTGRILDLTVRPAFRTGDFYAGIEQAVHQLTALAAGGDEANAIRTELRNDRPIREAPRSSLIIFIFILIFLFISSLTGRRRGLLGGGFWGGGFGGGGGGFGGGGGGWSGGGGSFGGGGSSSSW